MVSSLGAARRVGRLAKAVQTAVRTLTPLDTNPVPADWRHITKVDPEDEKRLPLLYPLYLSHTSAISVGGSSDVTPQNTEETFVLLDRLPVPVFHEPSAAAHVTDRSRELADFMAIPEVLNGDVESLIGELGAGTEYIRDELVPPLIDAKLSWLPQGAKRRLADLATSWLLERAIFEAYIIQNPESAAAREGGVTVDDLLSPRVAAQRALAAEKHLESKVIYLEYSGTFGGTEAVAILEAIAETIGWSRIWYGGGLYERADAEAVLEAGADAVVVGNVFHEIAAEEADLCSQAGGALDGDADREAVRQWIDERVDIGETSAAKYLSTIPSVTDPRETATEYLTATVVTWLALEELVDRVDESRPNDAIIRHVVEDLDGSDLPGADVLSEVLADGDGDALAREYALFHLGRRFGTAGGTLPLAHLGPF